MRRRDTVAVLGIVAAVPLVARAQQPVPGNRISRQRSFARMGFVIGADPFFLCPQEAACGAVRSTCAPAIFGFPANRRFSNRRKSN
jgi:hypothetical protein